MQISVRHNTVRVVNLTFKAFTYYTYVCTQIAHTHFQDQSQERARGKEGGNMGFKGKYICMYSKKNKKVKKKGKKEINRNIDIKIYDR